MSCRDRDRESTIAVQLEAGRRAALGNLSFGFIPPLSEYDREYFADLAVARTFEALAGGTSIEHISGFVKKVARDAAIDAGRRQEARNRSLDAAVNARDPTPGPEEQLEIKTRLAAGLEVLARFPADDSAIYLEKKLDGKKLHQLVDDTGRARRTISRHVKAIEDAIEKTGGEARP